MRQTGARFHGCMPGTPQRVRLIVRPGTPPQRVRALLGWLRALLPAAMLVVAVPGALGDADGDDVPDTLSVDVDADAVPSGPLSLATALTRGRR